MPAPVVAIWNSSSTLVQTGLQFGPKCLLFIGKWSQKLLKFKNLNIFSLLTVFCHPPKEIKLTFGKFLIL